jgi:2-(1,2-epoxy-1,2-dihydrophenyl)acetyl-CoA isomerase
MSVVVVERDDVPVLTLNRPASLNALNVEMLGALVDALREVRDEPAFVLRGAGRAFCVGEDLNETLAPRTGHTDELRSSLELLQEITRLIVGARAVAVAAVTGYAIGGGAELALACDLVYAAPQTRLRFPEVSLGHAVTGGISARLPLLVGLLKAKELLLTSRWIAAPEAAALGLVNEVADDPTERALEVARELRSSPTRSVAATKRALELGAAAALEQALHYEVEAATHCFAAAEATESIESFRRGERS